MQAKISAVIPLYNKVAEIGRALRSIAAQTEPVDEVIVVDDGSTDGSAHAVEAFTESRVRLIRQANAGECAARNAGVRAARNPLICFLDADDEWLPGFSQAILALATKYPQAGAYGTAFVSDKGPQGLHYYVVKPPRKTDCWLVENYFLTPRVMCPSSIGVRREVFDKAGYFRTGIRRGGDLDMWLRIAFLFPVAYTRRVHAVWHWTASNRACNVYVPEEYDFMAESIRSVQAAEGFKADLLPSAKRFIAEFHLRGAIEELYRMHPSAAKRLIAASCSQYGFSIKAILWLAATYVPPAAVSRALALNAHLRQRWRLCRYGTRGETYTGSAR